jgi:hypothetical protein
MIWRSLLRAAILDEAATARDVKLDEPDNPAEQKGRVV